MIKIAVPEAGIVLSTITIDLAKAHSTTSPDIKEDALLKFW